MVFSYVSTASPFSLVLTTAQSNLHDIICKLYIFIKSNHCNIAVLMCLLSLNACVLSCRLVCWPAWLSWRSAWPWTGTIRSYWLSPRSRCPYRSDTPPASGERRCVRRGTRGTLRPGHHRAPGLSRRPAGEQRENRWWGDVIMKCS